MGEGYIFTLCVSSHPLPGQQCEYMLRRGQYASCIHAGGLSCILIRSMCTPLADPKRPIPENPLHEFLVSEGTPSVMHSVRPGGKNSCQKFLVHPKYMLHVSTQVHGCQLTPCPPPP